MQAALMRLEFPKTKTDGNSRVILHEAQLNDLTGETGINYSTEWDMTIHAQRWSCYQMYASLLESNTIRAESGYPNDFFLPVEYHFDTDPYKGSGYDHGHICPSADRLYSSEANIQTFYLTNMQPQRHIFNAGIWEKMEEKLRSWMSTGSKAEDTLYVCKGGTIDAVPGVTDNPILTTLANGLIVPKYFFVALLRRSSAGYKALAFWVEHTDDDRTNDPLCNYVISVRELERLTGIDFFCNLPDNIEEEVENVSAENVKWLWNF
jgi:endonuclease G